MFQAWVSGDVERARLFKTPLKQLHVIIYSFPPKLTAGPSCKHNTSSPLVKSLHFFLFDSVTKESAQMVKCFINLSL